MNKNVWTGFLLGAVVAFLASYLFPKIFPASYAQSMGGSSLVAATGNYVSGQYEVLYVTDTSARKVAVYRYQNGVLNLLDVRNIKYDLQLDYYSTRQRPSVKQIMRKVRNR
ncbi:MAG: hypothetical protein D6805_06855 [Planctomycetota bacterium]|nr:MAG: hypothetical protein D6805_06855 [Planctomycetota bacterium]